MDKEEYNQIIEGLNYLKGLSCFRDMTSYLDTLEYQIYRRSYIIDLYEKNIKP